MLKFLAYTNLLRAARILTEDDLWKWWLVQTFTTFESKKIKSSLSSSCSTIVMNLISFIDRNNEERDKMQTMTCFNNQACMLLSFGLDSLIQIRSVVKKTLLIGWIYHIHERKNCLQGKNYSLFHQICFLKWACILVFSTILFFQNMEYLSRSTCTLINNINL